MYSRQNGKNKHSWSKNYEHAIGQDDQISLVGRKGGQVKKERQQNHEIDLELRDYTYR